MSLEDYSIKLIECVLYCYLPSQMLAYGCTRLEIGVQSVYEDVARDTNRLAKVFGV